MQEVVRGMSKLGISTGLGFSGTGLSRRTPPAHIGCLAGCSLFRLHVPGNHLPILAFFSPEQRDGISHCVRPLQAENGSEKAPIPVHTSFCSHLLEVIKSPLGIADVLRSLPIGNLVERER